MQMVMNRDERMKIKSFFILEVFDILMKFSYKNCCKHNRFGKDGDGDQDDQKFCAYKIMVINEWKDRKQTSRGLEEARLPHSHNTRY